METLALQGHELSARLVLETLKQMSVTDPGRGGVRILVTLHFSRSRSAGYVRALFAQLQNGGVLVVKQDRATLSASGEEYLAKIPDWAGSRLMEGRTAVREAIRLLELLSTVVD